MKDKKGDAMYEIIKDYSYYGRKEDGNYEWGTEVNFSSVQYGRSYYNSDYVLIGNTSMPFLISGGRWLGGISAGVFASSGDNGYANGSCRFPPSYSCKIKNKKA